MIHFNQQEVTVCAFGMKFDGAVELAPPLSELLRTDTQTGQDAAHHPCTAAGGHVESRQPGEWCVAIVVLRHEFGVTGHTGPDNQNTLLLKRVGLCDG